MSHPSALILEQLQDLLKRSYSPYSHYAVAAVIQSASGKLYGGVNVENAAYPLSRCAEQSAVLQMVSAGEQEISEVWVMTRGAKPGTPCGGCRQILAEFADGQTPIHCLTEAGESLDSTMDELLPLAFSGRYLAG